jgi:hypothetical protein
MEFYQKYKHIGNSHAGVPKGWVPIVEKALVEIEKVMWPQWIPMFLKRWIHYLATGNSVVRVKFWWAYRLRQYITKGQSIQDIKEKYAQLRIYGYAGQQIENIIERAEKECDETCQQCGGKDGVETVEVGRWYLNLCEKCHIPTREVLIEKY